MLAPLIESSSSSSSTPEVETAWFILDGMAGEDAIRCFQRTIDLSIRSKLFQTEKIANSMQEWLRSKNGKYKSDAVSKCSCNYR